MTQSSINHPHPDDKLFKGLDAIAAGVGLGRSTAWQKMKDRELAYFKRGKSLMATGRQLNEYLAQFERPAFNKEKLARQILAS